MLSVGCVVPCRLSFNGNHSPVFLPFGSLHGSVGPNMTMPLPAAGISFDGKLQLAAFCVFEACVGLFWPSMMKMRSDYLPEQARSTIINFFRIPLNAFVCVMLYNVRFWSLFSLWSPFHLCYQPGLHGAMRHGPPADHLFS